MLDPNTHKITHETASEQANEPKDGIDPIVNLGRVASSTGLLETEVVDETLERELLSEIEDGEQGQRLVDVVEGAATQVDPYFLRLLEEVRDHHASLGVDPESVVLSGLGQLTTTEAQPRIDVLERPRAAELLETQRFVAEAPSFQSQAQEKSRRAKFWYFREVKALASYRNSRKVSKSPKTEHQGLMELNSFLRIFISHANKPQYKAHKRFLELSGQASSMLENLTFIGQAEFDEAAAGIGELWKNYLAADPSRKLCILTEAGRQERYLHQRRQKSDEYLRDAVLATFSEEDEREYSDRIVYGLDDLDVEPAKARIVLLDDWTISGSQARSIYASLLRHPSARRFIDAGCLEMNLITAPQKAISDGLKIDPNDDSSETIPVRAYFAAHYAPAAKRSGYAHITGLHCAVNYGFYEECHEMVKLLKAIGVVSDPALASVSRPYFRRTKSPVNARLSKQRKSR